MKRLVILLILIASSSPILAQHFLTAGAGFGTMMYGSEDLDRFTESYNFLNGENLAFPLKGFGTGEGTRLEIGYRRLARLSTAVLAGLQNNTGKDAAEFGNGESRNLELKIKSLFVEYELGYARNSVFVNGVFAVFFNRKLTLASGYHGPFDEVKKTLTGTYKSNVPLAMDLGIAIGIHKDPIFLIGKITYPLYTGGKSHILEDRNPEKIANGLHFFPDDYVKYVNREAYKGVASDIDGLKIWVTAAIAIPL